MSDETQFSALERCLLRGSRRKAEIVSKDHVPEVPRHNTPLQLGGPLCDERLVAVPTQKTNP